MVMEDVNVKVVTVSELLRRSRPITATSSLHSPPSTRPLRRQIPPPSSSRPSDETSSTSASTNQNPNPRILTPLNHPATLIGTLTLPTHGHASSSSLNRLCSKANCFVFSDGSSAICCDVLDFDVRMIGKKIHVTSWNFIPFKNNGGFLEIIKWKLLDWSCGMSLCSSVNSFPLVSDCSPASKDDLKASYRIHGALESISPVSVVPCTVGSSTSRTGGGSSNLRGYLVQILACECKLCKSKELVMKWRDSIQRQNTNSHSFTKLVIVYFCGSASSWHPVITKLVGNIVSLSGLKKKLVFVGKEESQLMYVTTEKAFLHLPVLLHRHLPCAKTVIKGNGECATYTGIVKGIYMQGMVVELDNEVWLLLSGRLLTPPHSLRVGALISVTNVHFVNPKFSWTKLLILGACSKTSINVESFSPLETRGHIVSPSQSLLMKYIDSLAFSARLWVLLVVSCFQKKFAGFLSEQEILGSKHKEGLVQMYARSQLPSSVLQSRHGVFKEFCRHELGGCGSEPNYAHPKLVVPISYFVSHSKAMCTKTTLHSERDCEIMGNTNQVSILSCEGRCYCQSVRRILSSEDRSMLLLGILKISPSSGKLQLVDASGCIDVLIPDLPSFWNAGSIYEVNNYKLVMESIPEQADHSGLVATESFSCRHIFHSFPTAKETNLAIYVCFHLQNSSSENQLIYPDIDWKEDFEKPVSGTFHLLRVTHKFPLLQKFPGDPVISIGSSAFAEAIVLPWDLFLEGKDRDTHPAKVFGDEQKELSVDHGSKNYQDQIPCKRQKLDHASSDSLWSAVVDNLSDAQNESGGLLKHCSRLYKKCGGLQECQRDSSLLKVPCLATITIHKNDSMVNSGFLYCTQANAKVGIGWETNAQKVLLEFSSESYVKYQLLQIGGYYITNCHKDDLCNPKDSAIVSGVKVVVTLETYLWSLSFSPHGLPSYIDPTHDPLLFEASISNNEVISGDSHQIELILQRSTSKNEPRPDNSLHSSANVLLKIDLKLLEKVIKAVTTEEKVVNVSPCVDTTMPTSIQPFGIAESTCLLPEGNLISLNGHVVAVHNKGCNSLDAHFSYEDQGYVQQLRYSQEFRSSICIYVSVAHRIVRVLGRPSKYAYPVGFGSGVDATFYRILQLGQNDFMLTPISYVVISSIRVVNNQHNHEYSNLWFGSNLSKASVLDTIPSGLISDKIQCPEFTPMLFRSRVLAVHILVLESNKKYGDPQPSIHTKLSVNIPLAGFVLDDGSSLSCCWASAERASTFLRLHEEIRPKAFGSKCWTFKGSGMDGACSTAIQYVDKIMEKHGRVTVKNHGSIFDSSCQDLTFSCSADHVFSSSDENLLKFIISNACFGRIWTGLGKVMDLNAVRWLEKHLTEMEMTMLSLPNIWVEDVCHANSLVEARKVIEELQNG